MVPTPTIREELMARGFQDINVWTRGVDHASFRVYPKEEREDFGPGPVFLYATMAVETSMRFCSSISPGTKVLVGDGPYRKTLERKYPGVVFTGYRHGHDLARAYASGDCFVFPSLTDTFGVVMIERWPAVFRSRVPGDGSDRCGQRRRQRRAARRLADGVPPSRATAPRRCSGIRAFLHVGTNHRHSSGHVGVGQIRLNDASVGVDHSCVKVNRDFRRRLREAEGIDDHADGNGSSDKCSSTILGAKSVACNKRGARFRFNHSRAVLNPIPTIQVGEAIFIHAG